MPSDSDTPSPPPPTQALATPAILPGLVVACATNGASLVEEARDLAVRAHYARATALLVLGLEEYAKAFLCRCVELGFASFELDLSKPGAPMRACTHVLTDHKSKHYLIEACLRGPSFMPPGFTLGEEPAKWPSAEKVESLIKALDKMRPEDILKLIQEKWNLGEIRADPGKWVAENPELVAGFKRIRDRVSVLNDLKLRGLYVEERGGVLRTPSEITELDYSTVLADVEFFVKVYHRGLSPLEPNQLLLLRRFSTVIRYPGTILILCKDCRRRTKQPKVLLERAAT